MTRPYENFTDVDLQQAIDSKLLEIQALKEDCAEFVREQEAMGKESRS